MALSLVSVTAAAQSADFELERQQLNTSGAGTTTVWNGTLLGDGDMRLGATAQYANSPLVLHRADGFAFGTLVKNRATASLNFAIAPLPWLELGAQAPLVLATNGNPVAGLQSPTGIGLGTPWVTARAPLFTRTPQYPVNLGAELGLGIPAGPSGLYANARGVMVAPRVNLGFRFGAIEGAVELNAVLRPTATLQSYTGSIYDRMLPTWGAALGMTTAGSGTRAEVTARFSRNLLAPGWGAELYAGLRMPTSPTGPELFVSAGPGVGTLLGQPAFRILAGFAFGGPQSALPGPRWRPRPILPAKVSAKPAASAPPATAAAAPKASIAPVLAVSATKVAMAEKPLPKKAKASPSKSAKAAKSSRRATRANGRLSPHRRAQ